VMISRKVFVTFCDRFFQFPHVPEVFDDFCESSSNSFSDNSIVYEVKQDFLLLS
jgi:hypothetical protein